MCLILKNPRIYTEEDIKVVKYGIKRINSGIFSVPREEFYPFEEEKRVPEIEILPDIVAEWSITKSGLYSVYPHIAQAVYASNMSEYSNSPTWYVMSENDKFVVCEAIIPKGSKYVRNTHTFVSDRLIVLDKIIPNKILLNIIHPRYEDIKQKFY